VTFDGDAIELCLRCEGRVVNGDTVLLIAALKCNLVVRWQYNRGRHYDVEYGLELALKRSAFICCGERRRQVRSGRNATVGATLGGEQSGHILFRDGEATTDGF